MAYLKKSRAIEILEALVQTIKQRTPDQSATVNSQIDIDLEIAIEADDRMLLNNMCESETGYDTVDTTRSDATNAMHRAPRASSSRPSVTPRERPQLWLPLQKSQLPSPKARSLFDRAFAHSKVPVPSASPKLYDVASNNQSVAQWTPPRKHNEDSTDDILFLKHGNAPRKKPMLQSKLSLTTKCKHIIDERQLPSTSWSTPQTPCISRDPRLYPSASQALRSRIVSKRSRVTFDTSVLSPTKKDDEQCSIVLPPPKIKLMDTIDTSNDAEGPALVTPITEDLTASDVLLQPESHTHYEPRTKKRRSSKDDTGTEASDAKGVDGVVGTSAPVNAHDPSTECADNSLSQFDLISPGDNSLDAFETRKRTSSESLLDLCKPETQEMPVNFSWDSTTDEEDNTIKTESQASDGGEPIDTCCMTILDLVNPVMRNHSNTLTRQR